MPYEWVDAEPFVEFPDGKKVYCSYKNDMMDSGSRDWRFCLNPWDGEAQDVDICDWDGYNPKLTLEENIKAAYAAGAIFEENGEMYCNWQGESATICL